MNKLKSFYDNNGSSMYIGEQVTTTQHMVQAGMLAEEDKEDKEIILAAFLHDIGHFFDKDGMGGYGVADHDTKAYNFLKKLGCSERLCSLVRNHVIVKRYRVSKYPEYYNKLSEASKKTFEYQGGKLSEDEIKNFEQNIYFKDSLKIRDYDDKAKDPNIKYTENDLNRFFELLKQHLSDQSNKIEKDF